MSKKTKYAENLERFCTHPNCCTSGIDGHGDEIALVDCNFPAASLAQRLVRLDGAQLPAALEACMQLLPLDTFVEKPVLRMMQVHAPEEIPEVQRKAYAIVYISEPRGYGCLLLKKGVIFPLMQRGKSDQTCIQNV